MIFITICALDCSYNTASLHIAQIGLDQANTLPEIITLPGITSTPLPGITSTPLPGITSTPLP